ESVGSTSAISPRPFARPSSWPSPIRNTAHRSANSSRVSSMVIIRKRGYSRAALAGNPSDGYHGRTVAMTVHELWAEIVLYEWDTVDIVLADDDRAGFNSI